MNNCNCIEEITLEKYMTAYKKTKKGVNRMNPLVVRRLIQQNLVHFKLAF